MKLGLEDKSCEKCLRKMRLFIVENTRWRGDLIALYSYLKGGCFKMGVSLFSQVIGYRTRGMDSSCSRGSLDWILQKFLHQKCYQALEQAAQGNG